MAALAIVSCVACNKAHQIESDGEPCVLNVSLGEAFDALVGTRASGDERNDEKINSVQILVFNTLTGKLDGSLYRDGLQDYGKWTGSEKVNCTTGPRKVYAIVNARTNYVDGANEVHDLSEMDGLVTSLADNSATSLVMSGISPEQTFSAPEQSITVNVSRICASVVLKEVVNQMYSPAYQDKVRLTGAYIMNVPGETLLAGKAVQSSASLPSGKWYARNAEERTSAVAALLSTDYAGASASLQYGKATSVGSVFYTMPNDLTQEAATPWSQSATYLVVEADIDGTPCVYPIRLNAIESNRRYEVSLVLHRVGGNPDEPYKEIEFSDVTPTIIVTDWTEGAPINQEI